MFSTKFLKIFLLAALFAPACRFWQAKSEDAPPPIVVEELKSEIPFATKEPEVFQTEIVVTTGGGEDKIFVARNGANRLTIYDYQKKSEFALLQTSASGSFLIVRHQKIYAENQPMGNAETIDDFPTAELLNQKRAASFESLGAANGFAKYLVRLDASKNSEIIITVDEKINLPVKQEFYGISGEQKILISTTELKDFNLQPDAQNFELPKNYKKVSMTEFQDAWRRERAK
ncbi:MAG: hypothetical protein LH472_15860 [Pyrinomonadaceae bacterium]|nr:hypothetical protein [Pyrinomonadaceae bacterium]